jgi:hypothetical protein
MKKARETGSHLHLSQTETQANRLNRIRGVSQPAPEGHSSGTRLKGVLLKVGLCRKTGVGAPGYSEDF